MPRITGMVLASCLLLVIATQIGIVQASGRTLKDNLPGWNKHNEPVNPPKPPNHPDPPNLVNAEILAELTAVNSGIIDQEFLIPSLESLEAEIKQLNMHMGATEEATRKRQSNKLEREIQHLETQLSDIEKKDSRTKEEFQAMETMEEKQAQQKKTLEAAINRLNKQLGAAEATTTSTTFNYDNLYANIYDNIDDNIYDIDTDNNNNNYSNNNNGNDKKNNKNKNNNNGNDKDNEDKQSKKLGMDIK